MLELEMKLGQLLAFHALATRHLRYMAIGTGHAASSIVDGDCLGLEITIASELDRVRAIEKACRNILSPDGPDHQIVERKV